MKFKKMVILFITIVGGLIGLFLLFFTITDYKPEAMTTVAIKSEEISKPSPKEITAMIWNIGYGGLGAEADFFMDGGKMSIAKDKETVEKHIKNIAEFLAKQKVDYYFLQEVDINSRRSYYIDQYEILKDSILGYENSFALNYDVSFVPAPITKPLGKVKAGNLTFSKYKIEDAIRYSFPGNYSWPTKIFHLDRCFLTTKIAVEGTDNELILINTHNSAFDKGGVLRKQQLSYLKEYVLSEYNKGNYVVVGGDWNHTLPNVDNSKFEYQQATPDWVMDLPDDWTPEDWKWGVDINVPTCRTDDVSYTKGHNFVTTIDGYLISPNIDIIEVKGYNLDFEHSDHNPVSIKLKLK